MGGSNPSEAAPTLMTVLGPLSVGDAGVTDAHQHVWIEPSGAIGHGAPVLNDRALIEAGLAAYRAGGGRTLVDCQPGGCGRNAAELARLSQLSGVNIVACTGFHLRRYYAADHWLWSAGTTQVRDYFVAELTERVAESGGDAPIRAGFIKIACTADLTNTPPNLLEAAAAASQLASATMLIHTEQGTAAEEIVEHMTDLGVQPQRIVLCHVDKRPDAGLHQALASAGVLLEYDTFFRPKYAPDANVWPLVEKMLAGGYERSLAFGADLADTASWQNPGPAGLPLVIAPRLRALGCAPNTIAALTGANIASRLYRSYRHA